MQQEIQALKDNKTWEISDLRPDKRLLGANGSTKVKYNSNGTV